jgi:hypothetical protein
VNLDALQALYEQASKDEDADDWTAFDCAITDAWPALRDELIAAQQDARRLDAANTTLAEAVIRGATESDRLRLNAERYLWLRNPLSDTKVVMRGPVPELLAEDELDAAIDAALAQEPSK